jgi:hypothetical protein
LLDDLYAEIIAEVEVGIALAELAIPGAVGRARGAQSRSGEEARQADAGLSVEVAVGSTDRNN